MRKVLLVLLLLYTSNLSAQSLSLGGSICGVVYYNFRQLAVYNNNGFDVSFEISGQYTFKDTSFGVECTVISNYGGLPQPFFTNPAGDDFGESYPTFNLTTAGYFVFDPHSDIEPLKLQLKAGLFYSAINGDFGSNFKDWGPAFGLYIAGRIFKHCYLGLDVSDLIGTQKFSIPWGPPALTSQVSYTYFQLKLLCAIK